MQRRDSIESAIERYLAADLLRENFQLEQLTSGLKYPAVIVEAVNAKNKAIQEAQKAQNEVAVAEANAKSLLVAAQAEAEANRLKQQALTPQILEKMWIERWDGKLPQYGQVPTLFKDITNDFLAKDVEIGLNKRDAIIKLEIVIERYEYLFGPITDKSAILKVLPNYQFKVEE